MLKATFNIGRWVLPFVVALAVIALVVVTFRGGESGAPPSVSTGSDAAHLVSILQYLESDYPAAVTSNDAGELEEQRSLSAEALGAVGGLPQLSAFVPRVAAINARVQKAADGPGVGADCASLVEDLIAATGMARTPSAPPDLTQGARLFADVRGTRVPVVLSGLPFVPHRYHR